MKSNKSNFFREIAFWQFSQFKNGFLAIFEMAKNGIWSKKIIHEIDLFDFTSFLAWTFLNFLAHCGPGGGYLLPHFSYIPYMGKFSFPGQNAESKNRQQ